MVSMSDVPWIPVARPRLPRQAALAPYLEEIDQSRTYSNYGPLSRRFEARLAGHFGVTTERVVAVANGSLGLSAALMIATSPGTLCLMPAWTFVATAHAAMLAGLRPYFADVDAITGALTPEIATAALAAAPGTVGAVVPVLPFGQPIDLAAWDAFADRTGVAVVIDAAAGFDAIRPDEAPIGRVPVMVSLHATKALGIGEGGAVIAPDAAFAEDLRRRLNFGFFLARSATVPALNGKLSEYHAAVGLAALDQWPETRNAFQEVARGYRRALACRPGITVPEGFGERWVTSTCVVRLASFSADDLARDLGRRAIDTRQWWGRGAHQQPAFRDCPRMPLPVTGALAAHSLGMPCFVDLPTDVIEYIGRVVADLVPPAPPPETAVRDRHALPVYPHSGSVDSPGVADPAPRRG